MKVVMLSVSCTLIDSLNSFWILMCVCVCIDHVVVVFVVVGNLHRWDSGLEKKSIFSEINWDSSLCVRRAILMKINNYFWFSLFKFGSIDKSLYYHQHFGFVWIEKGRFFSLFLTAKQNGATHCCDKSEWKTANQSNLLIQLQFNSFRFLIQLYFYSST